MRILFVAMAESVHVGRWLSHLKGEGFDIHLYPSNDVNDQAVHSEIESLTLHQQVYGGEKSHPTIRRRGLWLPNFPFVPYNTAQAVRGLLRRLMPGRKSKHLASVINRLQPDLIHIIEFQHSGYLFLEALPYIKKPLPKIMLTNWGSDIYLFRHLPEHQERIKTLLQIADYYDCECERDIELAQQLGFQGTVTPVLPNTGSYKLEKITPLRDNTPPSKRRYVILKGYQNWAGRALFGLKALEMIQDLLADYTILIYSVKDDFRIAAELFRQRTQLSVELFEKISHEDLLRLMGKSRLYLGVSISDGISTAMLEAMTMGAFPIQTGTACANEWLVNHETGIIINDPENCEEMATALQKALSDDEMVDHAAEQNWSIIQSRLTYEHVQPQIANIYRDIQASL